MTTRRQRHAEIKKSKRDQKRSQYRAAARKQFKENQVTKNAMFKYVAETTTTAMEAIRTKDQLRVYLMGFIKKIKDLKDTDPSKYSYLSTDKIEQMLKRINDMDAEFAELGKILAKLNDTKTNTGDKVQLCLENATKIFEINGKLMEVVADVANLNVEVTAQINGEDKTMKQTLDSPDIQAEEEQETKNDVAPERFDDGEIDVPPEQAESILKQTETQNDNN